MPDEGIYSAEQIRSLAYGFQQSRIILTAIELDLFSVIDTHLITSAEAAKKIGTDERATDRLMNALTALGLLRKVHGKFYNTEAASQYLVKGKPEYMGGLHHTNNMWDTWSTLTESVKKGKSVLNRDRKNEKKLESFIEAMHYRAINEAKIISLMLDLSNVKKMLDVGGGSGAFSFEFIRKNPRLNAVIFDLDDVITLTKKYAAESGVEQNVSFISGDYLKNDFGSGYDLILLSAIVHINSYEQNKNLIKKCTEACNTKGQIIIRDFIMNDDRTSPVGGALFALNMLVATKNGDTYTEKEMREWFANAGIENIQRKNTSFGSNLLIGIKD